MRRMTFCFWQGKKAEKVVFYFWRRDLRHLFVSDSWYCQIQTTRLIIFFLLFMKMYIFLGKTKIIFCFVLVVEPLRLGTPPTLGLSGSNFFRKFFPLMNLFLLCGLRFLMVRPLKKHIFYVCLSLRFNGFSSLPS